MPQQVVNPQALNEDSSTADLLQALVGMGGGAGFKPIRQRRERDSRERATSPVPADTSGGRKPVPSKQLSQVPAPEKKSAWTGWGSSLIINLKLVDFAKSLLRFFSIK